jgi:hypothetical protein
MDITPEINVLENEKYPLLKSPVPPSVNIEAKMLDKVVGLKFMDHDITNEHKFS